MLLGRRWVYLDRFLKYDVPWGDAELAPAEVGMESHPTPEPRGLETGPDTTERCCRRGDDGKID